MQPFKKIKKMQEIVKTALERYPQYRDDDNRLTSYVWWTNLKENGIVPEKISSLEFLRLYADNNLPQADIITRARRKVQEDFPNLRGKLWEERHKSEKDVRKNI